MSDGAICPAGPMSGQQICFRQRFYYIIRTKNASVGFIRDTQKINAIISRLGFFIVVETDSVAF
jgi:hypothetical protein